VLSLGVKFAHLFDISAIKHDSIATQGAERNMVCGVWVILEAVGGGGRSSGYGNYVAGTLYIPVCCLWLGSRVQKRNNKATPKRGEPPVAPRGLVLEQDRESCSTTAPEPRAKLKPTPTPFPTLPLIHTNTYTIQNSVAGAFKLLFKLEEVYEMTSRPIQPYRL
jgi:hypothetical protein